MWGLPVGPENQIKVIPAAVSLHFIIVFYIFIGFFPYYYSLIMISY